MSRSLALLFGLLLAVPVAAQAVEVDVELLLMVDVSRSMSIAELNIQRRGYVAALGSDAVQQAIGDGLNGQIAVSYVENGPARGCSACWCPGR